MRLLFGRFVGIDWSGADISSATAPGLAIAEMFEDGARPLSWHTRKRSRDEIVAWIRQQLHPSKPSTVVGMDFSFGFPVGALRQLFGASSWAEMAATQKELVATHGTARAVAEAINRRPEFAGEGPFRTNETKNVFCFHMDTGIPYYRSVENVVPLAISGWYLGSGATVGYSIITGIAALGCLLEAREAGECDFRVWPFEEHEAGKHLIAEVYSAIWRKPVPEVTNEHERYAIRIATGLFGLTPEHLEMPANVSTAVVHGEGWILGVR